MPFNGGHAPLPPAPKPKPSGLFSNVGKAIGNVGRSVGRASHSVSTPHRAPQAGSDVQSTHGYDTGRATAFKKTPAYKHAVVQVFNHQPPAQKQAILKGAVSRPSHEGQIILNYLKQTKATQDLFKPGGLTEKGITSGGFDLGHFLTKVIAGGTGNYDAINGPGKGGKALPGGTIGNSSELFGGPKGQGKILGNLASDALNLPGNTVRGLAKVGSDALAGKGGNVFHDLVDPYVQAFHDPLGALEAHPLNTTLMFAGPEAAVGRGAGAALRSGTFGEKAAAAASTARDPLRLGPDIAGAPNPIQEARSYSPNLLHKGIQKAWEQHLQKRGLDPNVARPASRVVPKTIQNSLNIGQEAKLRRIADEMTAVRQMGGREARTRATHETRAAAPPKHVQNVVAHIMQSVVRTPETAVHDIKSEIARLKEHQPAARSAAQAANRAQIRDLSLALQHPELLQQAFESAGKLRALQNFHDAYNVTHGLLEQGAASRGKLFPYAIAHMGAKYDHAKGELVAHDGSPLPTQDILDHLKDHNVPDPAYVGHYPQKAGAFRFYQRYQQARGTAQGLKRTGVAFRKGSYDHTYEGLVAQAAKAAETGTKASLHDKVVSRLGITKPAAVRGPGENGMFTPDEARQYAYAATHDDNHNPIPGAQELVPISAMPAHSVDLVKDLQNPNELHHVDGLELQALDRAIQHGSRPGDATRNVVLVPKTAVDQLREQFKPQSSSMLRKAGQVTQQFRRTVLPYSTHWMTQIGSEAALRGLVAGVFDPRNVMAGHQLMNALKGSEEGRAALQEMVNATFYNKRDPMAVHNPNPGMVSAAAHTFPVTKALIAAHNKYADTIGSAMYGLEHQVRLMGLGKLARQQIQEFTGAYQAGVRLQGDNLAMLAGKMKTDPALVAKFGRQIDDTFGKYNKLSPKVRSAVQTVTPFLPWYLNAAKFVLWNLPVHHPVASSLMASLRQTINTMVADGKQQPLNAFEEQALAKIMPFGIFDPPKYPGPWGVAGQALSTGASTVLPQITGGLYNMAGLNSFGEGPLTSPSGQVKAGSPGAVQAMLEGMTESLLPGLRYARLAEEGGKPSYGTSTLLSPQSKPGAGTSVLNRIFNPFYAFERAGQAGSGSGGGGANAPTVNVPTVNVPTVNVPTVKVP